MVHNIPKYLSLLALLLSAGWLAAMPSWEPCVVLVMALVAYMQFDRHIDLSVGGPRPAEPPNERFVPYAFANEELVKLGLSLPPLDLRILGYSVHSLISNSTPLIRRSLSARRRVQVLLLAPKSAGLLEKSALEQPHFAMSLDELRQRNSGHIDKTFMDLAELANTIRYQDNVNEVDIEIRMYDQFPIFRGLALSSTAALIGEYLVDTSKPGRELDQLLVTDIGSAGTAARRSVSSFNHWFTYLWDNRSRAAGIECVIFDLYDTLAEIPEAQRISVREEMSQQSGIAVDKLYDLWGQTSRGSNLGAYASTKERFLEILHLAGRGRDEPLAEILESLEHNLIRAHARFIDGAAETLATLRRQGYRLGILTNCSPSVVHLFEALNLASFVDVVHTSFQRRRAKPDASMYSDLVDALGVSAERAVFVGDGGNDELDGARKADLIPIHFCNREQDTTLAEFSIRELDALPTELTRIGRHYLPLTGS